MGIKTIEEAGGARYNERNYLSRTVIKPSELVGVKGGEVIDLLNKPITYAGGHKYVSKQDPIYKRDYDTHEVAQAPSSLLLPEIVPSPRNKVIHLKRNSAAVAAKTQMENPTGRSEMKNLFESRRATENISNQEQSVIAKSLNSELRAQFIQNRKRT